MKKKNVEYLKLDHFRISESDPAFYSRVIGTGLLYSSYDRPEVEQIPYRASLKYISSSK